MSVDHWMMFGTFAQKDYFEYPKVGTYKGVVINANMAAHAPAGLASFLLEKTVASRYLIDPLTHGFQHDPKAVQNRDGSIKSSVLGIAEAYGDPVSSLVGKRALLPKDLEDAGVLRDFSRRVVEFQRDHVRQRMKDSDAAKYLGDDEVDVQPYALVAPYFYLSETTFDRWLPVNLAAASSSKDVAGDSKLFVSLVISKGVLADNELRERLVESYVGLEVDGYLIWIDDLYEVAASIHELMSLADLGQKLSSSGREVINLHGSYFSVLASSDSAGSCFSGVVHGPEFGEHRAVVPVGGGIPISRYYVPDLHVRFKYRDAVDLFSVAGWLGSDVHFHDKVCNCPECRDVISGQVANFVKFGEGNTKDVKRRNGFVRMQFPTKAAQDRCLRHYLQCKSREYVFAANSDWATIDASLEDAVGKYQGYVGLDQVGHLVKWKRVLSGFANP